MTFRSRKLLDASRGETCVRCDRLDESVVGAHYTGVRRDSYGGGLGIKVHDFCVADMDTLCRDKEGRWGHSEEFQHYVLLTLAKRFINRDVVLRTQAHLTEADVVETNR